MRLNNGAKNSNSIVYEIPAYLTGLNNGANNSNSIASKPIPPVSIG